MSVRKRTWRNADGSQGEAWVVAYSDHEGKRRIRSFEKRREANAYHASVRTDLRSTARLPNGLLLMGAKIWIRM
jgi:integrase